MTDCETSAPTGRETHQPPRLTRRAALDLSIDDELRRGEDYGVALQGSLRDVLLVLVDHELARLKPLTVEALLAEGPLAGPFRASRLQRRIELLIDMKLVRREGALVRPTVAGIAAVCRFTAFPGRSRPPQDQLRALRRAETNSIQN